MEGLVDFEPSSLGDLLDLGYRISSRRQDKEDRGVALRVVDG